jgi:hypothetical protein
MTEIESCLQNDVSKYKQDGILDKDETMDNVQERNNRTNLPSSQTFRSYLLRHSSVALAFHVLYMHGRFISEGVPKLSLHILGGGELLE